MTTAAFRQLCSWENLVLAWRKAARGKRGAASVARFEYRAEEHLAEVRAELLAGSYRPGPYVHFHMDDPKPRRISAAQFRDRVVHHALCNLMEPRFERGFIEDSYANRLGKGTHRAIQRLEDFARRHRYVLRADIVQHFASIDHAVLLDILGRQIPERRPARSALPSPIPAVAFPSAGTAIRTECDQRFCRPTPSAGIA